MGLPSIVTNWSGTADFVDESVGYLVNYTLSKASPRFYYDDICISIVTTSSSFRFKRISLGGSGVRDGPM